MKSNINHHSPFHGSPEVLSSRARPCLRFTPVAFSALHAIATKFGLIARTKLVLPCLALFFCLPGLWADTFGDFQFADYGTSITINGYSGSGGAIVIPSIINGKPVATIGDMAFNNCTSLTSVTIPSSVTSIGGWAFQACTGLTSVTIPSSVTSIGGGAFANCTSLTSATIPDGVTSIGDWTFEFCTSLTSITIPNSVTSIGVWTFEACTSLTNVTIPSSVTTIGVFTFLGCTGLKSVTIPNSVTSIGVWVFLDCTGLTSVTIPSSVTSIGEGAFLNCNGLGQIVVDADNPSYASVEGVLFNKALTSLIAFPTGKTLMTYSIPGSVTNIGDNAFYGCTGLTSVMIPSVVSH
jgi:hypothetical protein